MTEEDIKMLDDLDKRLCSFSSDISCIKKFKERLDTLYKIKENGIYDFKMEVVGDYGNGSSCSRRPEFEMRFSSSTNIPQVCLDATIKFYETEIKLMLSKLTSVVVVQTNEL